MFGTIASRYDLINHILSFNSDRRWRKKAALLVSAGKPRKILDVACGTGDLAIAIYRQMPGVRITGIDISAEMLEIGIKKVRAAEKKYKYSESDIRTLSSRKRLSRSDAGNSGTTAREEADIDLMPGNAETLDFSDASFDAVSIAFGIRNVKEMRKPLLSLKGS